MGRGVCVLCENYSVWSFYRELTVAAMTMTTAIITTIMTIITMTVTMSHRLSHRRGHSSSAVGG